MKVFLSWSKQPSQSYAEILYEYLPMIINLKPDDIFMSNESIKLGENGIERINKNLSESGFGILIMTPNNKNETWLNFEAGAISKGLSFNRVTPLVFDGKKDEVLSGGPIGNLQGVEYSKKNLLKIMTDINSELPKELQKETKIIEAVFESFWQTISGKVSGIAGSKSWYSEDQVNPDPIETKINTIHDILESRSISAQETYNYNQVVNWSEVGLERIIPIFDNIFNTHFKILSTNQDYLYSYEFKDVISQSFFNPSIFPDVADTPNNRMDISNLFKVYYYMKTTGNKNKFTLPPISDFNNN